LLLFSRIARSISHLGYSYQSGETDIQGRVSRCGDELARTALYEAANSLLTRSRKWSCLRAWGMKISKHRGMTRARVPVARKLAVTLHRMWADGAELRFGKETAAPAGDCTLRWEKESSTQEFARKCDPDRYCGDDGQGDLGNSPEPAATRLQGRLPD